MDQATISPAVTSLLQMGLPGIVIVALAFVVKHLFAIIMSQNATILQLSVDAKSAFERNTTVLQALTDALNRKG